MDKAKRKMRVGTVISTKMEQTAVVAVETLTHHPLYKKAIKRLKKFKAHSKGNMSKEGDIVRIVETRPLSKDKRWRIAEIIKKGETTEIKPTEIN